MWLRPHKGEQLPSCDGGMAGGCEKECHQREKKETFCFFSEKKALPQERKREGWGVLLPEKPLPQQLASMRYLADKQAERNDRNRYANGAEDVQQEVGMMRIQPCSDKG